MMGNRKLPFGYRMELGEPHLEPREAEIVRWIYLAYATGEGYKAITKVLNGQAVRHSEDKLWNINMIARILVDERYIGTDGFPAIVDSALWDIVQAIRAAKQAPEQPSELRYAICKVIREPVNEQVEAQAVTLLHGLLLHPEEIQAVNTGEVESLDAVRLQAELKETLDDETVAKQKILQIASKKYSAIGNDAYETVRLKRIFTEHDAVNACLIRKTVSGMEICDGHVLLRLRNSQIIEKETIQ